MLVKNNTKFFLLSHPPDPELIRNTITKKQFALFLLRPSNQLQNTIQSQCGKNSLAVAVEGLWHINCSNISQIRANRTHSATKSHASLTWDKLKS